MSVERLVAMANDIASYFESEPDREAAVTGVATHIRRYWVPRMRERIIEHLEKGGIGLDELARAGVASLSAGTRVTDPR
ncbi:MAG TPA: formate dehydrogenase subunit delta [Rhodanobacteraceae bacterium]|nr:formate dehydrogenase subunit delta [Rhodanobacteraceae bacterium]